MNLPLRIIYMGIAAFVALAHRPARGEGSPRDRARLAPPMPEVRVRAVVVEPPAVTLAPGAAQEFEARIDGGVAGAVEWSVADPRGGKIGARGRYQAPATPGRYRVVATSRADPSRRGEAVVTVVDAGAVVRPAASAGAELHLAVDTLAGARPISPYIFGLNYAHMTYQHQSDRSAPQGASDDYQYGSMFMPQQYLGITRNGGNTLSAHNWETNLEGNGEGSYFWTTKWALHARDWRSPGAAHGAILEQAFERSGPGISAITQVPIIGWVPRYNAADPNGIWQKIPVPIAPDQETPAKPGATWWIEARPSNPAGATAKPDTTDDFTFTDDLIKWIDERFPGHWSDPRRRIIVQLDNEPDDWPGTHAIIRGRTPRGQAPFTGYDEYVERSVAHARAVKAVAPEALVMAGSWASFIGLVKGSGGQPTSIAAWARRVREPEPEQYRYYAQYLLKRWRDAEAAVGRRLVDVIDFHWYPQVRNVQQLGKQTPEVVEDRIQAVRSLWDDGYVERSWLPGAIPDCPAGSCPLRLIPRMQEWVDAFYPGTKLAFTEWSYHRQGDVSSAIATADTLGVFARHGVFAAAYWPMGNASSVEDYACKGEEYPPPCRVNKSMRCLDAAFRIWRDYDGRGGRARDAYVTSTTSNAAWGSVYGTVDPGDDSRVVVVVINKRGAPSRTSLAVTHGRALTVAEWWQVTGGNGERAGCTLPTRQRDLALQRNALELVLPAHSLHVFVLR